MNVILWKSFGISLPVSQPSSSKELTVNGCYQQSSQTTINNIIWYIKSLVTWEITYTKSFPISFWQSLISMPALDNLMPSSYFFSIFFENWKEQFCIDLWKNCKVLVLHANHRLFYIYNVYKRESHLSLWFHFPNYCEVGVYCYWFISSSTNCLFIPLHILVAALLPFLLIYLYLLSITCITNMLLKYDFLLFLFLVVVMYNTFTFQWNWVSCCFSALPVICEVLFRIVCNSDDDHIPDIFFSILAVFSATRYYVHMEVWFWYGEIQECNCFPYEKANTSATATEIFVPHHL